MITALVVVATMILLNALFVAAELGAIAARRSRIESLAEDGGALAKRLLPVIESPERLDRYIAACQVGITVTSLVLGAYGQATMAPALAPVFSGLGDLDMAAAHTTSAVVILVALTLLQMVFGELVPKTLALVDPNRAAMLTVTPLNFFERLLAPLIWVLNGSGSLLFKLFGIERKSRRHIHSPAEIDTMVQDSREAGALIAEDRRRIRRALRLGSRRARHLMIPRADVATIEANASADEVLAIMGERPYARFPVIDGSFDDVVGILQAKDVAAHGLEIGNVRDLVRPPITVAANDPADRVLTRLRDGRAQQALVTEQGQNIGFITLSDVLSEIFGDVADELKPGRRALIQLRRRGAGTRLSQ